jgi:hypothetical protein
MTLQGQLAHQEPSYFIGAPVFEGDFGVLGNQPSQTALQVTGEAPISQIGLFGCSYDRIIPVSGTTTVANGVILGAQGASLGNFGEVIANVSGNYCGIIVNATIPTTIANSLPIANEVVANAESVEMAWLVENAQELGQYKGEWLLIKGQRLLSHSSDFKDVRTAVRERDIRSPFVYYVPTDDESNSVTI